MCNDDNFIIYFYQKISKWSYIFTWKFRSDQFIVKPDGNASRIPGLHWETKFQILFLSADQKFMTIPNKDAHQYTINIQGIEYLFWDSSLNSLGPSDAKMRHQRKSIFWHQIWIPCEISIQMNGNMTMVRSLLAMVASKASSSCVLSSWSLACWLL